MQRASIVLISIVTTAEVAATGYWWSLWLMPDGVVDNAYLAMMLVVLQVLIAELARWAHLAAAITFLVWALRTPGVPRRLVQPRDRRIVAWWGCYLVSVATGVLAYFVEPPFGGLLNRTPAVWHTISAVALIPAAVLAVRIIQQLSESNSFPAPAA